MWSKSCLFLLALWVWSSHCQQPGCVDPPGIVVTPSTNQTVAINSDTIINYRCNVYGAGRAARWKIAGTQFSFGSPESDSLATQGILITNGSNDSEVFLSINRPGREFVKAQGLDLTVACLYMMGGFVGATTGCKYYIKTFGLQSTVPDTLVDGVLTVCSGDAITITCIHGNTAGEQTRWIFSGPLDCVRVIIHVPPTGAACSPFTLTDVSDNTGPTVSSSARATATETLDGQMVQCLAGGLKSSPQAGNVTIRVISLSGIITPNIDSIDFSVEFATTGQVRITMVPQKEAIHFEGFVARDTGSVQVVRNVITLTGLDYTSTHSVNITAASTACPGIEPKSTIVPISFNITAPLLIQPVASVKCSDPTLPVRVSWTIDPGVQTSNDPDVSLVPPPTATPTISYSSTGGRSGSTSSDSPYLLTDTVRNDTYTFTVTVTNVAGVSSALSNEALIDVFVTNQSSVLSSNCLTVNISADCLEDITTGNFSLQLMYAFGSCRDLSVYDYTMSMVTLSAHSTCVPLVSAFGEFCYQATLVYQDMAIDSITNLNFTKCSIAELQSFLGAGVSYKLSGGVDQAMNASHFTTATLSCDSAFQHLSGMPHTTCTDGSWSSTEMRSCSSTNTSLNCSIADLQSFLGAGVSYQLDGVESGGSVSHLTTATLSCSSAIHDLSGTPQTTCIDGSWSSYEMRSCSIAVWVIVTIIAMILLVATSLVVVVVTVLCCCKRRSKPSTCTANDLHQSGPVYEQVDDLKPDPHTEGNLAYGYVQHTGRQQSSQPPTELRGQVYEELENFKPDPHTQGNVAYGQVNVMID